MALNSDRFESVAVVNPDEGIYVEMEGIMEVGSTKLATGGLVSVTLFIIILICVKRCATPLMIKNSMAIGNALQSQRTSKVFRRGSG